MEYTRHRPSEILEDASVHPAVSDDSLCWTLDVVPDQIRELQYHLASNEISRAGLSLQLIDDYIEQFFDATGHPDADLLNSFAGELLKARETGSIVHLATADQIEIHARRIAEFIAFSEMRNA